MTPRHITREIWALAKHHKDILERTFINTYKYSICLDHALGTYLEFTRCLRLVVSERDTKLLVASFSSSSIKITIPPFAGSDPEEIDYANPKFTDKTLTDMLIDVNLERRMKKVGVAR